MSPVKQTVSMTFFGAQRKDVQKAVKSESNNQASLKSRTPAEKISDKQFNKKMHELIADNVLGLFSDNNPTNVK